MKIVFVGPLWEGSTSLQRMRVLQGMGHKAFPVDTLPARIHKRQNGLALRLLNKIVKGLDWVGANTAIRDLFLSGPGDILWLDKALTILPQTLQYVKNLRPKTIIVGYSPDDMAGPHNQTDRFLKSLKYYDIYFTTKTYGVPELKALGCPDVRFVTNGYDPETHKPYRLTNHEKQIFGGPVGFIGDYEQERADSIRFLADHGVKVRIWGPNWNKMKPHHNIVIEGKPLWGEDYAKAVCAFDINLGFLRKINRDRQTQRSVEIPATRSFMLAERTDEHLALFEEGKEAEYFSSDQELLKKVNYYLENPEEREKIAAAGFERCVSSKYSYHEVIKLMLGHISLIKKY
ncbi:MAG: glycosyltransferase [Elusimicrobia bacterium]|nr:glycosyltransferase [Elusimicrobiota bacterium]